MKSSKSCDVGGGSEFDENLGLGYEVSRWIKGKHELKEVGRIGQMIWEISWNLLEGKDMVVVEKTVELRFSNETSALLRDL